MKTYGISEVAELMGVAPSAIRYYDSAGLLPDVMKVNGRRVFTDKDFTWLKLLNCLKATDMPIKEIRKYVELSKQGDCTMRERLDIILKQKQAILDRMEDLNKSLKMLEYKEWYYNTSLEAGTTSIHANDAHSPLLEPDKIPTSGGAK